MASANVETVFSGAGRISAKSRTLDPQLLSDYAYCHYAYLYPWLRPTRKEIEAAYLEVYGKDAHASDADAEASDSGEEAVEEEVEGEEEEEGQEQEE